MLKILLEKVDTIHEQIGNFSRAMKGKKQEKTGQNK